MNTIATRQMTMNRTTPGAVLYKADNPPPRTALTSIYLRKDGLVEPYPAVITVLIQVDDAP